MTFLATLVWLGPMPSPGCTVERAWAGLWQRFVAADFAAVAQQGKSIRYILSAAPVSFARPPSRDRTVRSQT